MRIGLKRWGAGLALVLLVFAAGCSPRVPVEKFKSADITGASWGKGFHLADQSGKPLSLADFKGKVVLLFFGYTHCPDVCPTTLAKLAQVRRSLDTDAGRVQVLFVTVDPARDTPRRLAQYLAQFDPSFVGLWGDEAAIAQTAKAFKVSHEIHRDAQGRETAMDHSGGVYAFDPQGRLRLYINQGESAVDVAHDIRLLLKRKS
jgi:protein SCO1/2